MTVWAAEIRKHLRIECIYFKQIFYVHVATYKHNTIHFKLTVNFTSLQASKISLMVPDFPDSDDDTASLEFFRELSKEYFPGQSFVWSINFRNLETNRVIRKELYLNIGLAFAAVFIVTLLLVANFLTCIFVCICVIFTLVRARNVYFVTLIYIYCMIINVHQHCESWVDNIHKR